jgi:hypothetical protein
MKTIDKDELYRHLGDFLKSKGVKLEEGSYAQRVRQGCSLLADVVNTAQKTVRHAKAEVDRKLSKLRQSIHEATAPKSPPAPPPFPATGPAQRGHATRKAGSARPSSSRAKTPSRAGKGSRTKSGKGGA